MNLDLAMVKHVPTLWQSDKQFRYGLEGGVIGLVLLFFCAGGSSSSSATPNYRPSSVSSGPAPVLTQQNVAAVRQQTGTQVVPLGPVAPMVITPDSTLDKTKIQSADDSSDTMNNSANQSTIKPDYVPDSK